MLVAVRTLQSTIWHDSTGTSLRYNAGSIPAWSRHSALAAGSNVPVAVPGEVYPDVVIPLGTDVKPHRLPITWRQLATAPSISS